MTISSGNTAGSATQNDILRVGYFGARLSNTNALTGTGWTSEGMTQEDIVMTGGGTNFHTAIAYLIDSDGGTFGTTFTWTGPANSSDKTIGVVTFTAAAAAAGPTDGPELLLQPKTTLPKQWVTGLR